MALVAQEQSDVGSLKGRVAVLEEQSARLEEDSVEKVIVRREVTDECAASFVLDLDQDAAMVARAPVVRRIEGAHGDLLVEAA